MGIGGEALHHPSPDMARTQLLSINTVSEWLAATIEISNDPKTGYSKEGMAAGKLFLQFHLVSADQVERETEKAIGVCGTRWNQCANPVPATVWFPKSQLRELANDKWINCADRMFLVPTWLINAKKAESLDID
jgi:hypothetical protein